MSLGMESGRTIMDAWLDEDEGGPAEGLVDIAGVHQSGIRVAALVSSPLAMPHLDPNRVTDALMTARWGVDVIIADLHPSYSDVNLAVFRISDRIVVPVTPDLPAIRAAVQFVEVATDLGLKDRLALVVNRANSGVSIKQIEQAVGIPAVGTIRSGGMFFVRAANEGRTVTDMFPKERVTADFEGLADYLLGTSTSATVVAPGAERPNPAGRDLRPQGGGPGLIARATPTDVAGRHLVGRSRDSGPPKPRRSAPIPPVRPAESLTRKPLEGLAGRSIDLPDPAQVEAVDEDGVGIAEVQSYVAEHARRGW